MAIVLTNGIYYIATNKKGGIIKTPIIEEAQTFYSVNVAMRKLHKAPGKCKGYYPYDTEDTTCGSEMSLKHKRKTQEAIVRKFIYDKANGCCQLCGGKILYNDMTLDHIVPISLKGTDDPENLQCACLACNQLKSNFLLEEFNQRIKAIFMYQIKKQLGNGIRWKIIQLLISKRKNMTDEN